MNKEKVLAGLDAGHVNTKAVIMRGRSFSRIARFPRGSTPSPRPKRRSGRPPTVWVSPAASWQGSCLPGYSGI